MAELKACYKVGQPGNRLLATDHMIKNNPKLKAWPPAGKADKPASKPDADAERAALFDRAKGLGVTTTKNMKTETLQKKIAEAEAADEK